MEQSDKVAFYWDQPVRIGYWRGRRKRHYTPDFAIYLKSREIVIAEVKDLPGMLDNRVQIKTEALMDFCSSHGFGLLLTDGKYTPKDLLKGRVNRRMAKELLKAMQSCVVRKKEWREIMERCGSSQAQLYRTIIRHELKFTPFPFKLQKGSNNKLFRHIFFEGNKYEELEEEKYSALFGNP